MMLAFTILVIVALLFIAVDDLRQMRRAEAFDAAADQAIDLTGGTR